MKCRLCRNYGSAYRHVGGFSLLEMLAVVSIMGILALIAIPRFGAQSTNIKSAACHTTKANLEVQTQLWFRNKGRWPAADLSDLGSDAIYTPDGLPVCPVDGSSYRFDSKREVITGHGHSSE